MTRRDLVIISDSSPACPRPHPVTLPAPPHPGLPASRPACRPAGLPACAAFLSLLSLRRSLPLSCACQRAPCRPTPRGTCCVPTRSLSSHTTARIPGHTQWVSPHIETHSPHRRTYPPAPLPHLLTLSLALRPPPLSLSTCMMARTPGRDAARSTRSCSCSATLPHGQGEKWM